MPWSNGMRLQRGMAQLPELTVSDSSEAMLSGRKPPFRLLVRAVHDEGRRLSIRHAVSEGFVVRVLRCMSYIDVDLNALTYIYSQLSLGCRTSYVGSYTIG